MRMRLALFAAGLLFAVCIVSSVPARAQARWVAPKNGIWKVSAEDEEGTKWAGRLRLVRTGSRSGRQLYKGNFTWNSTDGTASGKEYFTGSFDRSTGGMRLISTSVKSVKGTLGTGRYSAVGRRKGTRLASGRWWGSEIVPGKWTAAWSKPL